MYGDRKVVDAHFCNEHLLQRMNMTLEEMATIIVGTYNPPPLGVKVSDGVGTEDKFGE